MAETEMKSNAQRKKESIKEVTLMMEEFVQNAARRGEVYPSEKEAGPYFERAGVGGCILPAYAQIFDR